MPKAGVKGKSYIKEGGEWKKLDLIQDLTIEIGATEISIKNKGSNYEKFIKGLRTLPIEFPMSWDSGNSLFKLLQERFH